MKVTRKEIESAVRRVGKSCGIAGRKFKWEVREGFDTPEDDYPFADGSEASRKRGDWDGNWGGFRGDRKDMLKGVKMGRGADFYVYLRTGWDSWAKEWEWDYVGTVTFTLPETPEGSIKIEPTLDWEVEAKEIPFKA